MKQTVLPKRWQKFDDLLLIPAGVEIDSLEKLANEYNVKRIAQQNPITNDTIRSPGAKVRFFDDISFSRTNSNGTYRAEL